MYKQLSCDKLRMTITMMMAWVMMVMMMLVVMIALADVMMIVLTGRISLGTP